MFASESLRIYLMTSGMLLWFLLACMIFMVEIGWRIGAYFASKHGLKKIDASDTYLASIFGLLALLIALTFSGASDRFDKRRDLIVQEVSAIGTAYQSIDLLAKKDQPQIREIFKISKVGSIAGCMVTDGKIFRSSRIRIIREGVVVFTGELSTLKRFKDDVKEVSKGYDCGIQIKNYNDIEELDLIEAFQEVAVKKKLK